MSRPHAFKSGLESADKGTMDTTATLTAALHLTRGDDLIAYRRFPGALHRIAAVYRDGHMGITLAVVNENATPRAEWSAPLPGALRSRVSRADVDAALSAAALRKCSHCHGPAHMCDEIVGCGWPAADAARLLSPGEAAAHGGPVPHTASRAIPAPGALRSSSARDEHRRRAARLAVVASLEIAAAADTDPDTAAEMRAMAREMADTHGVNAGAIAAELERTGHR